MKTLILIALISTVPAYAMSAFIAWEINPGAWSGGRLFAVLCWLVFAITGMGYWHATKEGK